MNFVGIPWPEKCLATAFPPARKSSMLSAFRCLVSESAIALLIAWSSNPWAPTLRVAGFGIFTTTTPTLPGLCDQYDLSRGIGPCVAHPVNTAADNHNRATITRFMRPPLIACYLAGASLVGANAGWLCGVSRCFDHSVGPMT